MPAMEIVPLKQRPGAVPQCARWALEAWGSGRTRDPEVAAQLWRQDLAHDGLPWRWIAVEGAEVLGMAALLAADLPARPDLTPWLGDVFVAPAARGRGVARALVGQVEAAAAAAGVRTLYLFTDSAAGLYAKLGWQELCTSQDRHGAPVQVMTKTLG